MCNKFSVLLHVPVNRVKIMVQNRSVQNPSLAKASDRWGCGELESDLVLGEFGRKGVKLFSCVTGSC